MEDSKEFQASQDESLEQMSYDSRGESLLDEIEERLQRNWKIGIMLGNANSNIMTAKEKREFREKEYKDLEAAEQKLAYEFAKKELQKRTARKKDYQAKNDHILDQGTRKWLIKQGKVGLLPFKDEEIHKLKECFNSLDDDGSGAIGVEELLEPLIGLGFADRPVEVERMVELVDKDKSNQIEFGEFIEIIRNSSGDEKTSAIKTFFQNLSAGNIGNPNVSFNLFVLQERRKELINAIKENPHTEKRIKGRRIMDNVKFMLDKEKQENMQENTDQK